MAGHNDMAGSQKYLMVTKTLQVAEALLIALPIIKSQLGPEWLHFYPIVQRLHHSLQKGLHPEFNGPIIEALVFGYRSTAEPVIAGILRENGFDYRFITGGGRSFRSLQSGKVVAEDLYRLWERVAKKSAEWMAQENSCEMVKL